MAFLASFVAKKFLGETLENKFGREDPFFEQVPAGRLEGRLSGKPKRRKKALPPGLSQNDGQVLTKVKRRAYRLDTCLFSLCGVRFGWGSALGMIPVFGDIVDALMALMVLNTCRKIDGGLPNALRVKMLFNIMLDFGIGLIPFAGDLVDALFRANTRNAVLLEDYLREQGRKNLKNAGKPIPDIDPSDPAEYDRTDRDVSPRVSRPSSRQPSTNTRPSRQNTQTTHSRPTTPEPAPARDSRRESRRRDRESRGFWGRGKSRQEDVEMGHVDPPSNGREHSHRSTRR